MARLRPEDMECTDGVWAPPKRQRKVKNSNAKLDDETAVVAGGTLFSTMCVLPFVLASWCSWPMLLVLIFQGGAAYHNYGQPDKDRMDHFFGMIQFAVNLALLTNLMQYMFYKGIDRQEKGKSNPAWGAIGLMALSLLFLSVDTFDHTCRGIGFEWTKQNPRTSTEDAKASTLYGKFCYISTVLGMVLMFASLLFFVRIYLPTRKTDKNSSKMHIRVGTSGQGDSEEVSQRPQEEQALMNNA